MRSACTCYDHAACPPSCAVMKCGVHVASQQAYVGDGSTYDRRNTWLCASQHKRAWRRIIAALPSNTLLRAMIIVFGTW